MDRRIKAFRKSVPFPSFGLGSWYKETYGARKTGADEKVDSTTNETDEFAYKPNETEEEASTRIGRKNYKEWMVRRLEAGESVPYPWFGLEIWYQETYGAKETSVV